MQVTKNIKKILVANRSEIAIRIFRSAAELGIRTVAIHSYEDRYALHRLKADEAYQIGDKGEPLKSYLDIDKIIDIAKRSNVDAIHPGYGFLSENPLFAKSCRENNIIFIGPSNEVLQGLGDKVSARKMAIAAEIPILSGSNEPIKSINDAIETAKEVGYPVILKASHGGGGRGMRVVESDEDLMFVFQNAKNESMNAFGSDEVFIEKFIGRAKHIEVQLLGDEYGNLVHLYERDCSLQRRHQKVVEIAPSPTLKPDVRDAICDAAVKIGKHVNYSNAGTVEFLLDIDTDKFYFIEVNPRIQVEHTVTEEVTDIDIVKSQILIADGFQLSDDIISIKQQEDIKLHGFAIQCRVTTEDAANNFTPDYGKITHYRSASGAGIRLDAGGAFSGAVVNPYFDSMLVKITARGRTFSESNNRMLRALREFRVRGVKTNINFLQHLLETKTFAQGVATTQFIDKTPALFEFKTHQNRANKILQYIADISINGNPNVIKTKPNVRREDVKIDKISNRTNMQINHNEISCIYDGNIDSNNKYSTEFISPRQRFLQLGAKGFSDWILEQKELLITDTTMRDAHQSLLATRMRSKDLISIADYYNQNTPQFFSLEMWGGATFDTSMRFLNECPWERLTQIREKTPNILLQMLLRASSAVGYSNYPDNLVREFVKKSAENGIDVFRVFDALNYVDNMAVAMDAINQSGAICEAAICYTGDFLNPQRQKYSLKYYIDLAKQLGRLGAHIIAVKDMAGLCKPEAIKKLITEIKLETGLPVHFHTHDTSGMSAASIIAASDAGVDIIDLAMASISGNTSQPNMNTILESIKFTERASQLNAEHIDNISDYFRLVREFYADFESDTLPATSDLYSHEMPGGQYTNLLAQAKSLGISEKWHQICNTYSEVNKMFGDIVKVTPSSKAVGDMALFMVANDLTANEVINSNSETSYPASVIDLISGKMGQPYGGFPDKVKKVILKNHQEITKRPGELLPPVDFDELSDKLSALGVSDTMENKLTIALYPKVFADYIEQKLLYSDLSILPTPAFFYGMKLDEEIFVEIEKGKTVIIKLLAISEPNAESIRTVFFELNGQPREVEVLDKKYAPTVESKEKFDSNNPKHIGTTIPGMVVNIMVKSGEHIKKGQRLLSIEAMKMETNLYAETDGVIEQIFVKNGSQIKAGDLLITIA